MITKPITATDIQLALSRSPVLSQYRSAHAAAFSSDDKD